MILKLSFSHLSLSATAMACTLLFFPLPLFAAHNSGHLPPSAGQPQPPQKCTLGVFEVGFPGLENLKNKDICDFVKATPEPFNVLLTNVAEWLIALTIMAALLGIVGGGYYYMTAAGDGGRVRTAKVWIFSGLAGMTIAVLSWVILNLINPATLGPPTPPTSPGSSSGGTGT